MKIMKGKIWKMFMKPFVMSFSALLLALLSPFSYSANAINIDVSRGGIYQFNTRGTLKFTDGTFIGSAYSYSGGARAIEYKWGQNSVDMRTPSHVSLGCEGMVGNQFVSGSVINFYIVSTRDITDMLMLQPNSGKNATVLDIEAISAADFPFDIVNGTEPGGGWLLEGGSVTGAVRGYKITVLSLSSSNSLELIFSGLDGAKGSGHLIFFPGSYYTLQNETEDISSSVADLKSEIQASKDQAHSDAEKQLQATQDQTKQQQDQYDKEKQEEADREESGKEEGNKLLGIFNITLLNPFAGIWELFNPGGCTSIPTIASWLHSEDTTYCSWWPQSIRATLTPVFSIAAAMVLFGFFMSWLGSTSTGLDKSTNIHEGFHGF